ncbi:Relaxase/mobilization nuclease family protein, partial [mine drainage metagenome]
AVRGRRRGERAALSGRHRTERADLRKLIREERQSARSKARKEGMDPRMALALHAKRAADRTEALQKRQATERAALRTLPPAEAWRQWLIERAAAGDSAAEAALRGIRYRERRKAKRDAFEGTDDEALAPRLTVAALTADLDARRHLITYRGADGAAKFVDFGQRIEMRDRTADSLEAALRIAAEKYGGRVSIQGSGEFRERAARLATRIGVRVSDEDLRSIVTDERGHIEQEWRQHGISGIAPRDGAAGEETSGGAARQDAERVDEEGREPDR